MRTKFIEILARVLNSIDHFMVEVAERMLKLDKERDANGRK